MAPHSIFNSESDEGNWVKKIDELVTETNLAILSQIPVCIYQVPKSLSCAKPQAFSPQLIAIGPYNHFCPELYPMERFKIFAAKRVLDYFNKHKLNELVELLRNAGQYIRASYHKYLDLEDKTLLYTIAIDGLFLLDLFHSYLGEKVSSPFFIGLEHQVHSGGMKLAKDAIIRDVMMVENQIPTFVMLRILVLETSNPIDSVPDQECLGSMLLSFCEKHSPLKITHTPTCSEAVTRHHILDLMYYLVVSQNEPLTPFEVEVVCEPLIDNNNNGSTNSAPNKSISEGIVTFLKNIKGPLQQILEALKKLKGINIPLLESIKRHLNAILRVSSKLESFTTPFETEPPVVVTIPSVCELHSVGIKFQTSKGGIMTIEFDEKKGIFYLPMLKLDVNSEVIMRNLVAYEALTKPDFLIFTRYTELMRAIIDTVEDVKVLKDAKIIGSSSSLSVKETEELFNGMSKSIGPTKTEKLDETIKKVNKYFNENRKGKLDWILTNYLYNSWKLFTFLATFVLLAMTGLETFCSVYDCPRLFRPR